MVLLSTDGFLNEILRMLQTSKKNGKGSVNITIKRVVPRAPRGSKAAATSDDAEPYCVVRAVCGKRKVVCHLHSKEHIKFQIQLGNIFKSEMDNLQKRSVSTTGRKSKAQ